MKLSNVYLTSALASLLLMAACNKDDNNSKEKDLNTQDNTFLLQASQSNRAEVAMGNIAMTKGTNDSVKMYAKMMSDQHTLAQADLEAVVSQVNTSININDSLSADQIAMRNMLLSLPAGAAFDSTYISGQVIGHQQTLAAFNAEATAGSNDKVEAYEATYQPKIQDHLTMAQTIQAQLH